MNQEHYFSTKALAKKWKMAAQTLQIWRKAGIGPTYLRLGRCVRYTPEAVKQFEASPEFARHMFYVNRRRGKQS